jgi:hypothetical protein
MEVGYEVIVLQRWVIICKSSAEKYGNSMVGLGGRLGNEIFTKLGARAQFIAGPASEAPRIRA